MKKIFKPYIILVIVIVAVFIFACGGSSGGGDDSPPVNRVPSTPQLIYPSANLLCINNTITFAWSAATDPDGDTVKYKLVVAKDRDLTDIVEQRTVSNTDVIITLEKELSYYWQVAAFDSQGEEGEPTSTFAFYTEGVGVSNYAPFSAELVSPENNGSIASGAISLTWTGADTNTGDVLTYDVFFGEASDPPVMQSGISSETHNVTGDSGKTYYWKVNTTDDSGVKTIGQIWSFDVN